MAVDHLIYNKQKWVRETDYIKNYIGKKLTSNVHVPIYTIKGNGKMTSDDGTTDPDNYNDYAKGTPVVAQLTIDTSKNVWLAFSTRQPYRWVFLGHLIENGGVLRSLLSAMIEAVLSPRKEIAWC